ncbi:MAG: leucine-rich repeat protein [Prevotella sp.]|nr:leucine-rich repeat protein [Prevotella sp.]
MRRINYFLVFVMLLAGMAVKGQTFTYAHDGSVLVYKILDEAAKTCEVAGVETTSGRVVIPSTVVSENNTDGVADGKVDYTVTGVGAKSFYMCNEMTDVTIPNTVTTIGDEAFADCI